MPEPSTKPTDAAGNPTPRRPSRPSPPAVGSAGPPAPVPSLPSDAPERAPSSRTAPPLREQSRNAATARLSPPPSREGSAGRAADENPAGAAQSAGAAVPAGPTPLSGAEWRAAAKKALSDRGRALRGSPGRTRRKAISKDALGNIGPGMARREPPRGGGDAAA